MLPFPASHHFVIFTYCLLWINTMYLSLFHSITDLIVTRAVTAIAVLLVYFLLLTTYNTVSNLREVFNLRLISSNCRDETVSAPYIASTPDGWVYIICCR